MDEAARTALRSQITQEGYILIPEHRPGADIVEIANQLGTPLTPWEGGLVQTLTLAKTLLRTRTAEILVWGASLFIPTSPTGAGRRDICC